jgi:Tripartite ATP-independent periplasmic transporter, DctM component/FAD binding domain
MPGMAQGNVEMVPVDIRVPCRGQSRVGTTLPWGTPLRHSGLLDVSSGYDVVVIGAGAAGMSAALFSSIRGGALFIINNAIGLITPPVGVVLNVVCGVSNISMEDIIKGVWPFMIAQLVVLFLMVLFPPLVTVPAKWFGG